ncbi:MAG: formate dehydrogenase accessory sulfurtransferase FdhD [Candidatus Krumholzibacteria bacterium]|nr:formate dehydrogenase accessory sulfurtransferase FdhD [Candidatus Krumholzibacteria bacterium]
MYKRIPCLKVDGTAATRDFHEVIEEVPMALFVNGRQAMTAMMSPVDLEDFVIGYLLTEQIIAGVDEIESIRIEQNRLDVVTTNPVAVESHRVTIFTGGGRSRSGIDTETLPRLSSDYTITTDDIRAAIAAVFDSALHALTGGVHVVALLDGRQVVALAEDIGRHNALDRVVGCGARRGLDLSRTHLVISGRISSEMVRKSLVAGIPIIVSRAATTTLAVTVAERTGLTVVGFARGAKMVVYTHPGRIRGTEAAG